MDLTYIRLLDPLRKLFGYAGPIRVSAATGAAPGSFQSSGRGPPAVSGQAAGRGLRAADNADFSHRAFYLSGLNWAASAFLPVGGRTGGGMGETNIGRRLRAAAVLSGAALVASCGGNRDRAPVMNGPNGAVADRIKAAPVSPMAPIPR